MTVDGPPLLGGGVDVVVLESTSMLTVDGAPLLGGDEEKPGSDAVGMLTVEGAVGAALGVLEGVLAGDWS